VNEVARHARVVIIGGGAVGCSSLYHLAKRGWTDCLLLEMDELTAGSTWHAAGNCPNFSGSWSIMKLQRYSTRLYAGLGAAVDYPINYHVTGAIRLAQGRDRMDEFRHVTEMARHQGIDFEMLTPGDIKSRYPFIELHGLAGGQWDPLDGDIDPAQLTQAFAKGARDLGARIERGCRVTAIRRLPGREWRIETTAGPVTADVVVNAAGYRAAEIGAMVGRSIPSVAMSHQYLVTASIPELSGRSAKLPLLRDPEDSYYLRQERDALLLGPYEWKATPHWLESIPERFAFQLFPDDLERLEPHIALACARVPILGSIGVRKVINGPIPYTPDGNPLIGPAPGLTNFFEACVFSFGIVQAGGAGKALADWVVEGEAEWDLWSLDPRRFTAHATPEYTRAKAVELYQREYAISYPFEERSAGRPAKVSTLHERWQQRGALFGARNGWERPVWFAGSAPEAALQEKLTLRRPAFTAAIAYECRGVSEGVALAELAGFTRFEVSGPDAAAALDAAIAGALPRVGRTILAYILTHSGGVASEFTITRLAENRFWLLSATSAEWYDRDLLARLLRGNLTVEERTAALTTLIVAGPRSRELLAGLTDADLTNEAFPWLAARAIRVADVPVTAIRVSYVGELGWELHVATTDAPVLFDRLSAAGPKVGLGSFGLYAMDSMRLEKGYRSWRQDLVTDYSAFAAGLDRFVRLDKPAFPGRDALCAEKAAGGPADRLVTLLVDASDADAPATATVFKQDRRVGIVTSGGFGYRIGRSIALAYVRAAEAIAGNRLEIEIFGARRSATVATEPLYDPQNLRMKS